MERLANYGSDDENSTSDASDSSHGDAAPGHHPEPGSPVREDRHADQVHQVHEDDGQQPAQDERSSSPTYTPPHQDNVQLQKRRSRSRSTSRRRSRSKERHRSSKRKKRRSRSRSRSRHQQRRHSSTEGSTSSQRRQRRSRTPKDGRNSFAEERDHRRGARHREPAEKRDRFATRFDRATSKLAHLEKMGIDIKAQTKNCDPAAILSAYAQLHASQPRTATPAPSSGGVASTLLPPGVTDRLREQMERRKALWTKKEPDGQPAEPAAPAVAAAGSAGKAWAGTTFAHDQEGKQANKFKRLMGIREPAEAGGSAPPPTMLARKQEELFTSMEQQYEVARTATHTMRGVGLGFGSYQR